jgi:hypothetical protein
MRRGCRLAGYLTGLISLPPLGMTCSFLFVSINC